MEIRPSLPPQLIAEPPAGEVGGRLGFIGSPSTPQAPEPTRDSRQRSSGSAQVGDACNPGLQSHPPGHPAVQAPSLPPPCCVPRSARGRPRVRDSRALSHDSISLWATGSPAPNPDSLGRCAGASLGRPELLGGPMLVRPIRAPRGEHDSRTATAVVGRTPPHAARLPGGGACGGGAHGRGVAVSCLLGMLKWECLQRW